MVRTGLTAQNSFCGVHLAYAEQILYSKLRDGGDNRARTGDLLRAKQALSQLSYIPNKTKYPVAYPRQKNGVVVPSCRASPLLHAGKRRRCSAPQAQPLPRQE
jgi:hypothetical protein